MSPHGPTGRARAPAAIALSLALAAAAARAPAAETPAEPPAPPPPPALRPVAFADLPGWAADQHAEILPVLLASCAVLRPMRPDAALGGQGEAALRAGSAAAWQEVCPTLQALQRDLPRPPRHGAGRAHERRLAAWRARRNAMVRAYLEAKFEPFAAGSGIMTGYYEPILRGAATPDATFRTPLHARPPELVEQPVAGNPLRRRYGVMVDGRLEPYHDRAAIETGALAGRGLELVWVDDPADAFFLHIQGSGRVLLPDGRLLRVGYDGQNGRGYVPIGRILIERAEIPREAMSMQAIRAWLAAADEQRAVELLRANPSYVFFRRVDGLSPEQGPIGALGAPLTPRRSVAVDRAYIPLGAPMFVTLRDPAAPRAAPPAGRLVVAQDTGGAIRGPARTDFFWGWGPEAGDRAGRMREEAEVFLLLPRSGAATPAAAP